MAIDARDTLTRIYLVWLNEYCSISAYASDNGLTLVEATRLINLARDVFMSDHPES